MNIKRIVWYSFIFLSIAGCGEHRGAFSKYGQYGECGGDKRYSEACQPVPKWAEDMYIKEQQEKAQELESEREQEPPSVKTTANFPACKDLIKDTILTIVPNYRTYNARDDKYVMVFENKLTGVFLDFGFRVVRPPPINIVQESLSNVDKIGGESISAEAKNKGAISTSNGITAQKSITASNQEVTSTNKRLTVGKYLEFGETIADYIVVADYYTKSIRIIKVDNNEIVAIIDDLASKPDTESSKEKIKMALKEKCFHINN